MSESESVASAPARDRRRVSPTVGAAPTARCAPPGVGKSVVSHGERRAGTSHSQEARAPAQRSYGGDDSAIPRGLRGQPVTRAATTSSELVDYRRRLGRVFREDVRCRASLLTEQIAMADAGPGSANLAAQTGRSDRVDCRRDTFSVLRPGHHVDGVALRSYIPNMRHRAWPTWRRSPDQYLTFLGDTPRVLVVTA